MCGKRVVVLIEKDRLLRNRHSGFFGMLPIVQADANNLAGNFEQSAVGNACFRYDGGLRLGGGFYRVHELVDLACASLLQKLVESQWYGKREKLRGPPHVDHA